MKKKTKVSTKSKPVVKKAAAKKAPAKKKVVAKKVAPKKTVAKKAPVKKVVVAPKKMDEFDKLINDTKKPIVKDIDPRNFSEAELSNHIPSVSLLMVEEEKIEVDIEDEDDDFASIPM